MKNSHSLAICHGLMFGRQAYVGLGSSRFGTVTPGRQYDSVVVPASGEQVAANGTAITSAHAAINGLTASSTSNQFTARIGIRHKF